LDSKTIPEPELETHLGANGLANDRLALNDARVMRVTVVNYDRRTRGCFVAKVSLSTIATEFASHLVGGASFRLYRATHNLQTRNSVSRIGDTATRFR